MEDLFGNHTSPAKITPDTVYRGNMRLTDTPPEHDYYATHPDATVWLMHQYCDTFFRDTHTIWEPACGEGAITTVLTDYGFTVHSSDIVDRGWAGQNETRNFYSYTSMPSGCDTIITNPPYNDALAFVSHAYNLLPDGGRMAMLLKIQWAESAARYPFFSACPPVTVAVFVSRVYCSKNGNFERYTSAMNAYAWWLWEKNYHGQTTLEWIDNRRHLSLQELDITHDI